MKRHFSSFEALSKTYIKDTVAKKHGVWEFGIILVGNFILIELQD